MSDISYNDYNYTVAPDLAMSERRGMRYPNQFFDLSQQYMPPTIKELFKWCTFYYYNSPLIGAALKKMSRYPITDVIIEDSHESVRNYWNHVFNDCLHIKNRLMEISLDRHVYGNCFISLNLPFTRMLKCKACGYGAPIKQWKWKFTNNFQFYGDCPSCGASGDLTVNDVNYKDVKKVRILRWNPENIEIKHNEYTGDSVYLYTVPRRLRLAIMSGDKDIVASMPKIVIDAVREQKKIRMSSDNFIHLKESSLAEQDQGWGKPAILHVLKDMFYFYTLRRAQEAIALEHIVPFDIIYPMPNAQQDPYVHTDLSDWKNKIKNIIEKHRRDPNFKAVIPIPIGFGRLGGDGKALLLGPEIQYITQTVVGGLGIPQEFLFGGLNFCTVKSTYCSTSKGLLRMEELCPDDIGFEGADFSVLTKDGVEKVALTHHTDKRKQVKIKTRTGLTLTGSPIHRVWTISGDVKMGWKELQNFKTGEYVAIKKQTGLFGGREESPELCRLLGYLVSEGSVTEKCVDFSNTDKDILLDYQNCFESVFKKRPSIVWTGPSERGANLPIGATQCRDSAIIEYMKSIDMQHYSHDKRVPRLVREGTKETVAEFLKALFSGDGCITDRDCKQTIRYNSVSERLIEEVQLLLLNFGVLSTRYPPYTSESVDSFSGLNNVTHALEIRSEYVAIFMAEIGFTAKRKNDLYREFSGRESFRCECNKIPYVMENLKSLRKLQNGCGAWIKENRSVDLAKEVYTTKEVADILDRDVSSVLTYIRKGKLGAETEVRDDGRFCTRFVKRSDLLSFLDNYGTQKRASIGQTTWELTENNYNLINWEGVKTLDPALYERIEVARAEDHWWDEITEVTVCDEEVEMCDLTVYNTHSYVANGIVSHNTGSSVSLRTLENDFIQARTQMLDFVKWVKDKLRAWLEAPDVNSLRFADFRMADDIQKNQQLIGLNAAGKVSDQTMLTELGYDYETEKRKQIEEAYLQNYINEIMTKGQAKSQGEAQIISFGFQQKLEQLAAQAQHEAQMKIDNTFAHDNTGQIQAMTQKLLSLPPPQAEAAIAELKMEVPEVAVAIEQSYRAVVDAQRAQAMAEQQAQAQIAAQQQEAVLQTQNQVMQAEAMAPFQQQAQAQKKPAGSQPKKKEGGTDMRPQPNQKPPRRQGGV